jgi:two-component system sensor histidine kinase SenX3
VRSGGVLAWGGRLTTILALAAGAAIVTLLAFGYRATTEWQRSTQLLIAQDTQATAALLMTVLNRDMAAVQSRVLANRDWSDSALSLADTSAQVAIAFARYPYPESFFSWSAKDHRVVFFNRADRYPPWLEDDHALRPFPVILANDPPQADWLRPRIDSFGAGRFQYVAFNATLGKEPYQIIARLTYSDRIEKHPASVFGFTVNLSWVRQMYFPEILSQEAPLDARRSTSEIGVLDGDGRLVWGTIGHHAGIVKTLPLLFLNPSLGKIAISPDRAVQIWTLHINPADGSPLMSASKGANAALLVAGVAAAVLVLGLLLAVHAVQTSVTLAAVRSDFVSSLTHDLKMPLANISVLADTLALRPVAADKVRDYAKSLRREARRLTRLVDNVLAYARVTDVADVYSFQPLGVSRIVNDVIRSFSHQLTEGHVDVAIEIPDRLPPIRADRTAIMFAFSNLIDNAIQYSSAHDTLVVTASIVDSGISLAVRDHGVGIPEDELIEVQRKFVRGRLARPGGAGLGLSIVSRIMSQHQGRLELTSKLGVGTVASLIIPVDKS